MRIIKKYISFINESSEEDKPENLIKSIEDILSIKIDDIDDALDIIDSKIDEDEDNEILHRLHDDLLLVSLDIETAQIIDKINDEFGLDLSLSDESIEDTLDIIEAELDKNPNEGLEDLYNDLIEIYDDITEIENDKKSINESRKKKRKSKAKHKRRKNRKSKNNYSTTNYYNRPLSMYPYGYYNTLYRPYLIGYGSHCNTGIDNYDNSGDVSTGGGDAGGGDAGGGDAGGGE